MKRNDMLHSTDAIKINRENYRSAINLTRFARFLFSIVLSGESPLETRVVYRHRPNRH